MPNSLKPAFLIYWSIYPAIEELSYEEKGKLFDSIFLYTMGKEIVEMTGATKMAFNFIKQSLDLDTVKYESIVERNRINGLKGGRPKNPENPVGYLVTQKTQRNPEEPKKANKNININKNINNKDILLDKSNKAEAKGDVFINRILETFKEKVGHQPTDPKPRYEAYNLVRRIKKLIKEVGKPDTEEQTNRVIDKYFEWLDKQDWFVNVQNMSVIRRKFEIYQQNVINHLKPNV